jgi:hypothetical protein
MALNSTISAEDSRPEFEVFPKLPTELRLKIFELAASEPRIIEISYDKVRGCTVQKQPSPPLLRTNRESHGEVLRQTDSLVRARLLGRSLLRLRYHS